MGKKNTIEWASKLVNVADIKPTPNNYKIKTDLGKERLATSLKSFGLAGTIVLNTDLSLIDGNSRWEEAKAKGAKKIWASLPNRKLSAKEYHEMSAMFDFAKAGEVDLKRIEQDLGSTKEFYDKYKLSIPMAMLDKMGIKAEITPLAYPEGKLVKASNLPEVGDIKMVQLFFSTKQESEFRTIEERLMKKFKTANTTDTVLKALKSIK